MFRYSHHLVCVYVVRVLPSAWTTNRIHDVVETCGGYVNRQRISSCYRCHLVEDTEAVEGMLCLDRRAVLGVERRFRVLELLEVGSRKPLLRGVEKTTTTKPNTYATTRESGASR